MQPAALERQLREDPDDDASWRVYADWLLEQGDRRGELIVACAERPADDQALSALRWSCRGYWPGVGEVLRWRYGFALDLRLPLGADVDLPALMEDRETRLLSTLRLRPTSDAQLAALAGADLTTLATLDLGYAPLDAEAIADGLGSASAAPRRLRLRRAQLANLGALGALPWLAELQELDLAGNAIDAEGLAALITRTPLPRLEVLDLRDNPLGADGARLLAESGALPALRLLRIDREDVGPEGLAALAASPRLDPGLAAMWSEPATAAAEREPAA